MKTISTAYRTRLALKVETAPRPMCWLCVRKDGTVLALTELDQDVPFNLEAAMIAVGLTPGPGVAGIGARTYSSGASYTSMDIATSSGLNVDTGEAHGVLAHPSITADDMLAGLWDFTRITSFRVCWADLSAGAMLERSGTIGEITTDNGFFKAEWRGIMQAYQQNIGRLYSPVCDVAKFGDARCKKDLTALTFPGAVTGLGPDTLTFLDTSLTQPGPAGGIAVTNITNANPGRVTMAGAGTFRNLDPVTLSTIVGMPLLNTTTIIRNLSGLTWDLGINTTDTGVYGTYASGGVVTPLGGTPGFFDVGTVTWLTGLNAGLTEVVKSYTPGQVVLQLPMPYAIAIGDTYTIVAGCIRSQSACRDTHNNMVNRRAYDYFPGIDKMVQVGVPA